MKDRTALTIAGVMSGRYDDSGKTLLITGTDAYGNRVSETVYAVDAVRLKSDVDAILNERPDSDPPRAA